MIIAGLLYCLHYFKIEPINSTNNKQLCIITQFFFLILRDSFNGRVNIYTVLVVQINLRTIHFGSIEKSYPSFKRSP